MPKLKIKMFRYYIVFLFILNALVELKAQSCIEITQPAILSIACAKKDVTASGAANGEASVTASGGTAPYTYLWSNNANVSSVNSLLSGVYTVTVTDASNCFEICQVTVNSPVCTLPNAGIDQLLACVNHVAPTNATLTAAPLGYSWQLKNQPSGAAAMINNNGIATGLSLSGDYYFELVSDTDINCKDEIKITVPICTDPCISKKCGTTSIRKL